MAGRRVLPLPPCAARPGPPSGPVAAASRGPPRRPCLCPRKASVRQRGQPRASPARTASGALRPGGCPRGCASRGARGWPATLFPAGTCSSSTRSTACMTCSATEGASIAWARVAAGRCAPASGTPTGLAALGGRTSVAAAVNSAACAGRGAVSTTHSTARPRVRGTARSLSAVSRPRLSAERYVERREAGADM